MGDFSNTGIPGRGISFGIAAWGLRGGGPTGSAGFCCSGVGSGGAAGESASAVASADGCE
jgi:hypothetical protein